MEFRYCCGLEIIVDGAIVLLVELVEPFLWCWQLTQRFVLHASNMNFNMQGKNEQV
jgi:hypothetical protein